MKKTVTLLMITLFASITFAQKEMDKPFIHWNLQTPVISLLDLRTGELKFTVSLKENPYNVPFYNEEKDVVYAVTKHYAYKIDANNGDILIEYQFTDILQQKASDMIDPNMMLIPAYFDKNGTALFFNMNEQVQNQLNKKGNIVTVKKVSTENQTTSDFMMLDYAVHSSFAGSEGKFYLSRIFKPGDKKIAVDVSLIDKFQIVETFDIPIDLSENDFGLSNEMINSASFQSINGNEVNISLSEPYDLKTNTLKSYTYTYNIVENKRASLIKYDVSNTIKDIEWTFDCKKDFDFSLIIPEKPPMPTAPETFIPKKFNKKGREEMERINAERLQQFQKELDEWQIQQADNSGYIVKLFELNNGESTLVKEFYGTMGIALYEDRYVFYANDLEFVMHDLSTDKIIWSILR